MIVPTNNITIISFFLLFTTFHIAIFFFKTVPPILNTVVFITLIINATLLVCYPLTVAIVLTTELISPIICRYEKLQIIHHYGSLYSKIFSHIVSLYAIAAVLGRSEVRKLEVGRLGVGWLEIVEIHLDCSRSCSSQADTLGCQLTGLNYVKFGNAYSID